MYSIADILRFSSKASIFFLRHTPTHVIMVSFQRKSTLDENLQDTLTALLKT